MALALERENFSFLYFVSLPNSSKYVRLIEYNRLFKSPSVCLESQNICVAGFSGQRAIVKTNVSTGKFSVLSSFQTKGLKYRNHFRYRCINLPFGVWSLVGQISTISKLAFLIFTLTFTINLSAIYFMNDP